jgi:thiamine biosynthesis lipoprotein
MYGSGLAFPSRPFCRLHGSEEKMCIASVGGAPLPSPRVRGEGPGVRGRGGAVPVATILLLLLAATTTRAATLNDERSAMGSRFEITAVHADEKKCLAAIDEAYDEIERIEQLLSEWRESSPTSEINRKAGVEPVVVPQELYNLVRRSIRISKLTDGAFDITFHTVGHLWNFKSRSAPIPDDEAIRAAMKDIGYARIILDDTKRTVFLDRPGTRIGFGAIGKGYAANRAVFVLREHGVSGGIINAGGDLVIFGLQEDGEPWRVGIANPLARTKVFAFLDLTDQAVVTSGDYENYIEIDGRRYSHILDPRTGYPVEELRSVTILCPDGELADALATAVSVLGVQRGLDLVNGLNRIEAMLVGKDGNVHFSDGLEAMMTKVEDHP